LHFVALLKVPPFLAFSLALFGCFQALANARLSEFGACQLENYEVEKERAWRDEVLSQCQHTLAK